jgi:hypothetical protein
LREKRTMSGPRRSLYRAHDGPPEGSDSRAGQHAGPPEATRAKPFSTSIFSPVIALQRFSIAPAWFQNVRKSVLMRLTAMVL